MTRFTCLDASIRATLHSVSSGALAILLALTFVGCAGSYYTQYRGDNPDWSGIIPDPGSSLEETLAGIHAPRQTDAFLTIRKLEILRIDQHPWQTIQFSDIRNGTFQAADDATYAIIAFWHCTSKLVSRGRYAGEKRGWYLLPKGRLEAYLHYEFVDDMCTSGNDFRPARDALVPTEHALTAYMDDHYPPSLHHQNEILTIGLAYLEVGRLDDARTMLEQFDRSIDSSAQGGVRHDGTEGVARYNRARAEQLRRGVGAILVAARSVREDGKPKPSSLITTSMLAFRAGKLGEAEVLMRRAIAAIEVDPDNWGHWMELPLIHLAQLRAWKGDVESGVALMERALLVRKKLAGKTNLPYASYLAILTGMHVLNGDVESARRTINEASEIAERVDRPEDPRTAMVLLERGYVELLEGENAAARDSFRRAVAILSGRSYAMSMPLGLSLVGHAAADIALGNYSDADSLMETTYQRTRNIVGSGQPALAIPMDLLALSATLQGDYGVAIQRRRRANELSHRYLEMIERSGVEEEWRRAVGRFDHQIGWTVELAFKSGDPAAHALLLDTLQRRKGRVLETTRINYQRIRDQIDPSDRPMLDELAEVHAELGRLVLRGPASDDLASFQTQTKRLAERAAELEDTMTQRSAAFRAELAPIDLPRIRSYLPDNAALIEFAAYGPIDRALPTVGSILGSLGKSRYAACVLRRVGDPRCVDLGEAKSIDDTIRQLRAALSDPRSTLGKKLGRELDELVVRPLRSLIGDAELLLLSPDGDLNLVPFAALVDENGDYLIERFTFSYLTTGRELVRMNERRGISSEPLILVDPDFNLEGAGASPSDESMPLRASPAAPFVRLPDTALEGELLARLLGEGRLLSGAAASKRAILEANSPSILHIATHAFWLESESGQAPHVSEDGALRSMALRPLPANENPLLRSGLALAGANDASSNGLLTALEVSSLDLQGTNLVVLSACDTGLGELHHGEGVYGLRRAFMLAGAETQVSSLWKIADQGTRRFMEAYYKRVLAGGGRASALRAAQLEMLESQGFSHPFFWAAFTSAGSWTPFHARLAEQCTALPITGGSPRLGCGPIAQASAGIESSKPGF